MSKAQWWFHHRWSLGLAKPFAPPVIKTLTPTGAAANSTIGTLTVTGTDFSTGSVINFAGANQTTTFVNSKTVLGSSIAAGLARSVPVYVTNNRGQQSNTVTFTVS